MKGKNKISALVLTHNETEVLEKCLKSIKSFVDEIVVIDDYSEEKKTLDILKKYGCKIYKRKLDNFSSQRNFAISKIKSEWILWIDSDEVMPTKLISEMRTVLKNPQFDAYRFYRNDYFLNVDISVNRNFSIDKLLIRLFKKNVAHFENEVHEELIIKGNISKDPFKTSIEHYSINSINHWVSKMNLYTDLEAKDLRNNYGIKSLLWVLLKAFYESCRYFFGFLLYFGKIRLGFKAIIWASLSSFYVWIKYFKYYELVKKW